MRFKRSFMIVVVALNARIARAEQPALLAPPGTMAPVATLPKTATTPAVSTAANSTSSLSPPPATAAPTPPILAASASAVTPSKPDTSPVFSKFLSEPLPTPPAGDHANNSAEDGKCADGTAVDERRWYERAFLLFPAPWDTGIELGINGSAGTSDSFSMRTGGYMKRESRFSRLDMSTYYNRTDSGGKITQNNAQFDVRNDWLLDEKSPWTLFAQNNVFYDEFKDFDVQTNLDTGLGYRFWHEKTLELIGRAGFGTSREIGGADSRWVPEGLTGVEYRQQISQTQKVYAKVDYFPEVDQASNFRAVADTGWEVVLVQPSNLSLKICATDRYDSTPAGGAEPHLVNYSVMLLLKL